MSVQVIGSGTIGGIDEGLVVSGIVTATELDISGDIDVDGHTNLDNVNVSGATTCNGGAVFLNSISLNASSNNYLYFDDILNFTRNGHGAEMIIDGSGRVGVNYNDSTNSWGANFRVGGLLLSDAGSGSPYVFGKLASAQDFVIGRTDPGGSFNAEHFRIKAGGNIGMGGNTNPTNVLHIKTAVTNTAVVTIESTATDSYPFLRLKNDAREYQLTCHGGNSDAFVIYDGTSSANRLIIDSNGGVDVVGGYIGRNLSDSFTLNGVNQPHYGFQLNPSSSVPVAMSGYFGIAFATEGTERARIERAGHLVPGSNNSYDLGSSSKRWRNVYTTDLQLSNKGKTNDVDDTWGDYTIQEGESDLFLINNRNGKKYKFNLTEVS
tara:strand:+ start:403 stop:1536 length:1134 start_codon:yes stop_codon:yes gene_type:complete